MITPPGKGGIVRLVAPVREQVVEAIRQRIFSGELVPGQRLVERDLTEQLDVSRNTLREAYRQLEAEGFLILTPHKGPVVYQLTKDEAAAVYELRQAIECLAVQLFVERASDEQVEVLAGAVAELRVAHEAADITMILESKNRFYEILYQGAQNPILPQQINILQGRLMRLRAESLSRPGRLQASLEEIEQFLESIRRRDVVEARDRWHFHIENASKAALESDLA